MSSASLQGLLRRTFARLVELNRPLTVVGISLASLTWLVSALVGFSFPDLWWQLQEGLDYLNSGVVPETIAASYAPQIPGPHLDYFLYEVCLALLHRLGGLGLLRIIFVLIALFPFAFTLILLVRAQKIDSYSTLCLTMSIACLFARVQQRPELLAFSVMLLLGIHLTHIHSSGLPRLVFAPLVLMAAWTNLHASFIMGMAMCAAWAGSSWLPFMLRRSMPDRRHLRDSALTLASATLGGSLHPDGLRRWIEPFALQDSLWSNLNSSEMWPPPDNILIFYTFIVLLMLTSTLMYRKVTWQSIWMLVFPVLFLAMFVSNYRYIAFAGITFLWLALLPVHGRVQARHSTFLPIIFIIFCIPLAISLLIIMVPIYAKGLTSGSAINSRSFDHLALEHLARDDPHAKIFSDIRAASFAAHFYPHMRYYIHTGFSRFDSRALETYFHMNHDPVRFLEELKHMRHPHVLVGGWNPHWALALDASPDYKLAFLSNQGSLYVPAAIGHQFQTMYDQGIIILPQLSRLDSPALKAEVLSHHFSELSSSSHGVLFLEFWLRHQTPDRLADLRSSLPPGQAAILDALVGKPADTDTLPPRVAIRHLIHRGDLTAAASLYDKTITYPLRRDALRPVFLEPWTPRPE